MSGRLIGVGDPEPVTVEGIDAVRAAGRGEDAVWEVAPGPTEESVRTIGEPDGRRVRRLRSLVALVAPARRHGGGGGRGGEP